MKPTIKKDMVIIGAGPAGLSAAVYAGRAKLDAVLLEKGFQGGQLLNTEEVDNYLGVLEVTGPDLSMRMFQHTQKFGIEPQIEEVMELDLSQDYKKVITSNNIYLTKTVIFAMGAMPKELGLESETRLKGRGVSYCAICDGGFFADKVVAVVGGGDRGVEDALYLNRMAKKVYLIHRRDTLRANKVLQDQLFKTNVEIIWDSEISEIHGEDKVSGISIINKKDGEKTQLDVDGVFVAVGNKPTNALIGEHVATTSEGYVIAGEDCKTSVPGVFVAGDLRQKPLRQILTAAADGAVCVYEAEKYILETF